MPTKHLLTKFYDLAIEDFRKIPYKDIDKSVKCVEVLSFWETLDDSLKKYFLDKIT
jgi:hypothetical protein